MVKKYERCPHCSVLAEFQWTETKPYVSVEHNEPYESTFSGASISHTQCPSCQDVVVVLNEGEPDDTRISYPTRQRRIYPLAAVRNLGPEVPPTYVADFSEACSVQELSPKASAALSRRLLQRLLRDEHAISPGNLAQEIEAFIHKPGLPSHLGEEVDAIRNIGNFAAHPMKSSQAGELVDVEPDEVEWQLEVLEALLDYTFVQSARLSERKKRLDAKLGSLGKPPMKTPKP